MRIVAGEKRSRVLCAPEGNDTRPTADKVREALFSVLGGYFDGEKVLDLYAGSGALALEALSRGAGFAVLCDLDRKAAGAIRKNIEALDYADQTRFLNMTDQSALSVLEGEKACFDLVFLDPPYKMDTTEVCKRLVKGGLVHAGSRIIIEHRKETPPRLDDRFRILKEKTYGITGLIVCTPVLSGEGEEQA